MKTHTKIAVVVGLVFGLFTVARAATVFQVYQGGTGFSSARRGELIMGSADHTATLSKLATGSASTVLTMSGGIPAWLAPATSFIGLLMGEGSTTKTHITSLTYDAGGFNLSPTASSATLTIDYTNGPASRSADQNITGLWTFANTGSMTNAGSFNNSKGIHATGDITTTTQFSNLTSTIATGPAYALGAQNTGFFGNGTNIKSSIGGTNISNITTAGSAVVAVGSSSYSGSLSVAKGLTANSFQGGGLTVCNTATNVLWYGSGQFSCHTLTSADIPDLSGTYLPLTGGTLTGNLFGTNASMSGTVEAPTGKFATLSRDSGVISIANNATASLNFEVVGYASSSKIFGSTLSTCSNTQGLTWAAGTFSCVSLNFQPLDSTLTALAAYNTNGILTQTAADTFTGRTITGTAAQVTVSNGDGVSGNPTLSLPALLSITNASASAAEFTQYASASKFFGSGLTTCNSSNFLQWASGLFACGTPAGGSSFSGLDFGVIGGTQVKITSISFDANQFDLTNTASSGTVRLDWTNGPASRAMANTWTALNTFGTVPVPLQVRGIASVSAGIFGNYLSLVAGSGNNTVSAVHTFVGDATPRTTFTLQENNHGTYSFGELRLQAALSGASTVGTYLVASGSSFFNGGKLGIGNTSPTTTLDVTGNASISNSFEVGTSAFVVLPNGNIGIASSSPRSMLDIKVAAGTDAISIASSSGATMFKQTKNGFTGIGVTPGAGGFSSGTQRPMLQVGNNGDNNTFMGVQNTNATGTAAAAVFRTQASTAIINFQSHGDARTVNRFGFALGGWNEMLGFAGKGMIIGTFADTPLVFGQNSLPVMTLGSGSSTGYVGINTTQPKVLLHLSGAASNDVFAGMGVNPAIADGCAFGFGYSGNTFGPGSSFVNTRTCTGSGVSNPVFRILGAGNTIGTFWSTGDASISRQFEIGDYPAIATTKDALCEGATGVVSQNAGLPTCTVSSLKYKDRIKTLNVGALDTLAKLRVVSYFDKGTTTERLGLIAEEVDKVEPRLVAYEPGTKNPRGVNYEELSALNTQGIQELKHENDALKARLDDVEARLAKLDGKKPTATNPTSALPLVAVAAVTVVGVVVKKKTNG